MGVSLSVTRVEFRILAEHRKPAFLAIKALGSDYRWVDTHDLDRARTLAAAIDAWGWRIVDEYRDEGEPSGDVIGIEFEREKLGDEDELFSALAPFVVAGSFIEARADGELFRWVFDGQTCRVVQPRIDWGDGR